MVKAKTKPAGKRTSAKRPDKAAHTVPGKVAVALDPGVIRNVRKLRAAMEIKTGERVTLSGAVACAVEAFLKR